MVTSTATSSLNKCNYPTSPLCFFDVIVADAVVVDGG